MKIGSIPFFLATVKVLLKLENVRIFSAFCIYFDMWNITSKI